MADNEFAYYLVVTTEDNQELVLGYGGMWLIIDESHITNIAIAPEHREKLGELLMGVGGISCKRCVTNDIRGTGF